MAEYSIFSILVDEGEFYSKIEELEEIILKDRFSLRGEPAASVVFNGSSEELYKILGYDSADITIQQETSPERKP